LLDFPESEMPPSAYGTFKQAKKVKKEIAIQLLMMGE